jgi:phage-related protein
MIETGVRFDRLHSYHDLHLILSKVDIPAAKPKTNYVDIPGSDGSLDMTETHGEVKYKDRECKFTFTMPPVGESEAEALKSKVNNAINGKTFRITLDKDPGYYYLGRCEVDSYSVDRRFRQIVVKAKVSPWKFKQNETVAVFALNGTEKVVSLSNSRRPVSPVITCTADTTITFGKYTYILEDGSHKVLNIRLTEGKNTLTLKSRGTVTFTYQEGEL